MIEHLMKITASYIHNHHNVGVFIAAFISFLESLAIVGSIIPGSVTMTIVGSLIGSGVLNAKATLIAIFIGGMIGDYVSFWCGYYYKNDIKNFKITKRYEKFFIWGEEFIKKQGMKSIVIGRFFGPMRSMIPMVAGILSMPRTKFILAAIPSVLLWEICYLTPGIILGAFAIELPPNAAFKFVLLVLSTCLLIVILMWLIGKICSVASKKQRHLANIIWAKLLKNKESFLHTYIADHPQGYMQLIKLAYILIMSCGVTYILCYLHHHNNILNIDYPIQYLMTNIYSPLAYKIMLVTSYLGDKFVIFPTVGVVALYLTFKKEYKLRLYLVSITVITAATIGLTKHIFGRIRPMPEASLFLENFSFPSGHILLSTALLCFIVAIICHNKKPIARILYYQLTGLFLLCVTFARIYVGAHWFSDVLVSSLIGFIIANIYSFCYYRKATATTIMPVIKIGSIAYVIFWLSYSAIFLNYDAAKYIPPSFPTQYLTTSDWQQNQHIDIMRKNIFGMPVAPLNIQWIGDQSAIEKNMLERNWQQHKVEPEFLSRFINALSSPNFSIKPIFAQKYHHKPAVMIFSYETANSTIILKLWESNIFIKDQATPMWLGSLYLDKLHTRIFSMQKDYSAFNILQSLSATKTLHTRIIPVKYDDSNFAKWDHNIMQLYFIQNSNGDKND